MIKLGFFLLALTAFTGAFKLSRPHANGRIFGGEDVDIKDYPYQLSLHIWDYPFKCGAVIINSNWALTTATCVADKDPDELTFRAGSSIDGSGGTVHEGINITVHPDNDGLDYDFALVKVDDPFDIGSPGIDAINIANSEPDEGTLTTVTGWGITTNGTFPRQLQAADLTIVDRDVCADLYDKFNARMICAAAPGKDSCEGDNGCPLIDKDSGELVGIVSWGLECADPRYPGVYASVSVVKDWITEVTEDKEET